MKNLTWQNPEQLFVAQELINKVKSKCCGIKDREKYEDSSTPRAISYDSAGRVSKVESVYDEETDYTLYYYNSKGLLVKAVEKAVDMSEENTTVYKYGDYEFDSHGNWTSRSCEFEVDGNSVRETQMRNITYYK